MRCASSAQRLLRSKSRSTAAIERPTSSSGKDGWSCSATGGHVSLRAARTEDALQGTAEADAGSLVTPLPGTVVAVHVTVGQRVERGAPLITIEAMKMEHTVTAPYAGTIERMPFALADRVAAGAVLVELKSRRAEGLTGS